MARWAITPSPRPTVAEITPVRAQRVPPVQPVVIESELRERPLERQTVLPGSRDRRQDDLLLAGTVPEALAYGQRPPFRWRFSVITSAMTERSSAIFSWSASTPLDPRVERRCSASRAPSRARLPGQEQRRAHPWRRLTSLTGICCSRASCTIASFSSAGHDRRFVPTSASFAHGRV
jgi:hypothetical protein